MILSFIHLLNPIPSILVLVVVLFLWAGLFIVQPNQAAVLQFFGKFVGVERTSGLRWANPFYTKKTVTLRAVRVARYEPASVIIAQGLGEGEIVVTAGVQALRPGQKIRLLNDPA